jgi:competence protein ComEC
MVFLSLGSERKLIAALTVGLVLFLVGLHLTARDLQRGATFEPTSEKCLVNATVGQTWATGQGFRIFLLEQGINVTQGGALPGRGRLFLRQNDVPLCAGDRIAFATRLRKPLNRGNPGEYDWEMDCATNGIGWLASVQGKDSVLVLNSGFRLSPAALLSRVRASMGRFIETYTGEYLPRSIAPVAEIRGILKGIILGDMGEVDPELNQSFADSGLVHMLSASGLHVGIVVLLAVVLTKGLTRVAPGILLYIPFRKAAAWASIPAMVTYCVIVGARVPAVRSTIMGLVVACAILMNRRWNSLNSLLMAAVIILLIYPLSLLTPSFQLSFVAVAGILLAVPPSLERLYGKSGRFSLEAEGPDEPPSSLKRILSSSRPLTAVILTSAAATLAVFPFLIQTFHSFPLYTLLANLAADFMMTGALSIGLMASLIGMALPGVASVMLAPAAYLVWAIVEVSRFFASLPGSTVLVPHLGTAEALLVAASVFFLLLYIREPVRKRLLYLSALSCSLLCALVFWHWIVSARNLEAVFLNVGRGDAAFIRSPGSAGLLIDGGVKNEYFDCGRSILLPFLRWNGSRTLDGMIISHPEMDHMGGLLTTLGRVPPLTVWWNPVTVHSQHLDALFAAAGQRRGRIAAADRTQSTVPFGTATIRFLNPARSPDNAEARHTSFNNASVVCRIEHGEVSFLFTGDLESEGEQELLASGLPLAASVLKVGHHGSRTSTSRAFLEAVRPRIAVISCEGPIFRSHPHRSVLERLESAGAAVYITGRDGAVILTSDGRDLQVKLGRPDNRRRAVWAR